MMSNESSPTSRCIVFGPFRVDMATGRLWRNDVPVPLPPRSSDLLLLLLAERHRVVDKEELLRRVWPDAFVAEDSLTQAVSSLRKALGDTSRQPAYILTVPTRGYRFIADVRDVTNRRASPRRSLSDTATVLTVSIAAVLVAAATLVAWRVRLTTPARTVRFVINPPAGMTFTSGGMLSPDATHLAFTARDRAGRTRLFVRDFDTIESRTIPNTDDAQRPFWSPDSAAIGFFAHSSLKTADIGGQRVETLSSVGQALGGAWGRDGNILFAANRRSALYAINAAGGPVRPVTTLDPAKHEGAHRWPQISQDGRRYFFWVVSADANHEGAYVVDAASGRRQRILDGTYSAAIEASSTRALSVHDGTLMEIPLAGGGVPAGKARLVARDVAAPDPSSGLGISAAGDRALAYLTDTNASHLVWFDRSGARIGTIEALANVSNPVLSGDDSQVVVQQRRVDGEAGIWLIDLPRGTRTLLTAHGTVPLWSPDGTTIAFTSGRSSGVLDVYRRVLAARDDELMLKTAANKRVHAWSPNGRYIVYVNTDTTTKDDLWLLPVAGDQTPVPYLRTPFNERGGQISPDGRWLAYTSDESGTWEVYVQSFPVPGNKRAISVHGGMQPQWRRDGRELFFLALDHTMMAVDITQGATLDAGVPRALFRVSIPDILASRNQYAVASAGDRFLVETADADVPPSIVVVLNWDTAAKN